MHYRIKELCVKLVIKTSLQYDAGSEKNQIRANIKKVVAEDTRRLEANPECIQDGFWDHRR
jgi:hypothetical protein